MVLIAAFAADAGAIWGGFSQSLDHAILLAFRTSGDVAVPIGPAWLAESERDLTGLGSNGVMGLLAIAMAGAFAFAGRRRHALMLVAAILSAEVSCGLIKIIVQRPRPDLIPDIPRVFTTSFPSSHAMVSAATLFMLAAIQAERTQRKPLRRYIFAMAAIITFVIGVSRLYLGVHWPSDVLAGWLAGLICAWGVWTSAELWVRSRSKAPLPR